MKKYMLIGKCGAINDDGVVPGWEIVGLFKSRIEAEVAKDKLYRGGSKWSDSEILKVKVEP